MMNLVRKRHWQNKANWQTSGRFGVSSLKLANQGRRPMDLPDFRPAAGRHQYEQASGEGAIVQNEADSATEPGESRQGARAAGENCCTNEANLPIGQGQTCETKPIRPGRWEGVNTVRRRSYDRFDLPRASEKQSQFPAVAPLRGIRNPSPYGGRTHGRSDKDNWLAVSRGCR